MESEWRYPLPAAAPPDDWGTWRALLLAAIEAELKRPEVWRDEDVDQALQLVEALIVFVAELEIT